MEAAVVFSAKNWYTKRKGSSRMRGRSGDGGRTNRKEVKCTI